MDVTTALAFVLSDAHVDRVNSIRAQFDKAVRRWPPHINFIFPFVSPDHFEDVVAALNAAPLGGAFPVIFDDVGFFPQKANVTFHLKLSAECEDKFQTIYAAIRTALPHVVVRRPELKPHLTLGQCPRSEWPVMERKLREWLSEGSLVTTCEHIVLLNRSPSTDDKMIPVHTVPTFKNGLSIP